jgi:hypothetical protein
MQRRHIQFGTLAILCGAAIIAFLPSNANASQYRYLQRHHLARYHAHGLHFYPIIPIHAAYTLAPAPNVIEAEALPASTPAAMLFAYPAHGQSEQQQSQDRYECHTWAAGESGFDPVAATLAPIQNGRNAAPNNLQTTDYTRAMGACLVARGYSVN